MVCSANITVKQQSRVLTEFLIFVCTRHAKIYHVVTFYSRHATANKIKKIRAFASCFTSYCECRISTFLTKKISQEKILPSPYSKGTKRDATATTEALRKSSFKDLQELLVLLYIRYVVFGEGFGLLRPFFKFKKFAWQHCLHSISIILMKLDVKRSFALKSNIYLVSWKCCSFHQHLRVVREAYTKAWRVSACSWDERVFLADTATWSMRSWEERVFLAAIWYQDRPVYSKKQEDH